MKLRWAALIAVLAFSALMMRGAWAQTSQPPRTAQRRIGSVGQNYPNPFNPDTRFRFTVGDTLNCAGQRFKVTARIVNLLGQHVATPVIEGGSATVAGNSPIENVDLECGAYVALWNGKFRNTNREAASGFYIYRLEVNGRIEALGRMFLGK